MEKKYWEISWGSLWRIAAMLILISFFYFAKNIIIALLVSIVISSALDPIVSFLERKKLPRVLGTLLIFLLLLGSLALLLYIIVPVVLAELNYLIDNLTSIQSSLFGLKEASAIISTVNNAINKIANMLFSGSVSFSDVVSSFFGSLALAFSVFALAFYLTVDRDGVEKFLRAILPPGFEDKVLTVYFRTRYKIGKWLQGQIFLSLSVGVGVSLGLWILGVKYSLVLGIFAGLLEMVPFVGPILSGAVAIVIAFPQSLTLALYVLILFIIIQQIESQVLLPIFMKLTTNLHPVVILVALLVGGEFLGIVGLILAVPVAVGVQEVINNWTEIKARKEKALI